MNAGRVHTGREEASPASTKQSRAQASNSEITPAGSGTHCGQNSTSATKPQACQQALTRPVRARRRAGKEGRRRGVHRGSFASFGLLIDSLKNAATCRRENTAIHFSEVTEAILSYFQAILIVFTCKAMTQTFLTAQSRQLAVMHVRNIQRAAAGRARLAAHAHCVLSELPLPRFCHMHAVFARKRW